MNSERFDRAKTAYDSGDYTEALRGYYACLKEDSDSFVPGDAGLVYHMLGNCLVKMRRYSDAIPAYSKALDDGSYAKRPAVHANLGMAFIGLRRYDEAVTAFNAALEDPSYETPYRAYSGLGNAYMKLGRTSDAGTAYRNAAIDETNPNPVKALLNLGICFMALERPKDAIEAYLAALEFNATGSALNKTYANLGQAYVQVGRMQEAVNAFQDALRDGSYFLSDSARADYMKACQALGIVPPDEGFQGGVPAAVAGGAFIDERAAEQDPYASSVLAGFDEPSQDAYRDQGSPYAYDPYDQSHSASDGYDSRDDFFGQDGYRSNGNGSPVLYGGGNVPSAENTGFFTVTDDDLITMSKNQIRKERKLRHTGLKVFLVLIILVVLALGAAVFAYTQGYGYPTQEQTIEDVFAAHSNGESVLDYWIESDSEAITRVMDSVGATDSVSIDYLERGMTDSSAVVTANLTDGGQAHYNVALTRDMIGWKISGIELDFASNQE